MNSVPDGIVYHILSQLRSARDIASCTCVSRRWRDTVPYLPVLFFPRNAFDSLGDASTPAADAAIDRMVKSAERLEELVVYCPFTAAALASWLNRRGSKLRRLELRMERNEAEEKPPAAAQPPGSTTWPLTKLDCIGVAKALESLKLWGVSLTSAPRWILFPNLKTLEIVGAVVSDDALAAAIAACPNLVDLALISCEGASTVNVTLSRLETCRLDFLGHGHCSLSVTCPRLLMLDVQGFTWIQVHPNHRIRSLSVSKVTGRLYRVDFGKLEELEHLSIRGVQWTWSALTSLLQCASSVRHLVMKVEFCGDFDHLQPFPQVDLVEFFNAHPMLRSFEIHGAMFAALCHKDSLRHLDSNFSIPCLERVVVTVRSPLNAEQKLGTLESIVKFSACIKRMVIRISQMRNCQEAADDFFEEICRFAYANSKVVRIE